MESNASRDEVSLFEKLPCELRNRIYRYTVVKSEMVNIVASYSKEEGTVRFQQPALSTILNKQIRNEALLNYYAENTFTMPMVASDECSGEFIHESFFQRAVDWARSCGSFISLVTKVGAFAEIGVHISEPGRKARRELVHRLVSVKLSRHVPEGQTKLDHRSGLFGKCKCVLQRPRGSKIRLRPKESVAVIAIRRCRRALWQGQRSSGRRCDTCGLESGTQPL